ncbi:hypothetical protein K435DRAFT_695245 [Dendrothele bispora CBS 962.96]|uniref:Oxidized purine nucleoside triphosphate hydrolase n=1 Tax=Dendrothele bispora (strain CBS 962.96) TaxID=1314807 RepID=A0A4S8KXB9_DENBC|nr:hypothetical protein K435DRAFT_695245 [Dendrothele bispora CBS 962.96]
MKGEGEEAEVLTWIPCSKVKFYTNAFVVKDGKILLGYKKRGFGAQKYNGFGGKVEAGETSLQAAGRELEEESGISSASLVHAGVLFFVTEDSESAFHIDIYRGEAYEGIEKDVRETDEMRPEWFDIDKIPYDKMWEDDVFWMPMLLDKKWFWGRADFRVPPGESGKETKQARWWFGELEDATASH